MACGISNYIYIVASESQILYAVFVAITQNIFDLAIFTFGQYMSRHFACIPEWGNPPSYLSENQKNTIISHLDPRNFVNNRVMEQDPLVAIKVFRNYTQTICSKNRGVDGSSKALTILRSSAQALKWEQNVFFQVFKTLCVNSFIS